jgi:hypothetical protein
MTDCVQAFRGELRSAALRRIATRKRRLRLGLLAAAVVLAAVGAGITVAATDWPLGEPAPPAVVTDFESYTPQLGFNPDARGARLVAHADGISLYATRTRQGTYCTVVATPWRGGKTMGDGGSCVSRETAAEPIAAGIRDTGRAGDDRRAIVAIVGRVRNHGVRTVRFTIPDGEAIEARIGAQGFFVAAAEIEFCPKEDWTPTFTALNEAGHEVASASILLVKVHHKLHGCGFPVGPHGPYESSR